MKLVLGLDSLLGGPLCPLFVISPGRMLGQVENGATTRIYVAVSSIVICTSHAAFYDCTLHEWIFLECLLYCIYATNADISIFFIGNFIFFSFLTKLTCQINFYQSHISYTILCIIYIILMLKYRKYIKYTVNG